jgi:N4-(beta-N-acetylglucosaminyl)-L-asparaginase
MKRRSFFKFSLATALTSLMKPESIFGMQNHEISTREAKTEPVVISTWSHGIEANEEAWKVLENNGKSLDAVEQGVKITEADLSNRSVGIGGRPDRDGHVTLDACIMDER